MLLINRQYGSEVIQCFVNICFASKLEGVAVSTKGMQDNCFCRGVAPRVCKPFMQEWNLRLRISTTMQPNIGPIRNVDALITNRDHKPIRLNGIVDV